MKPRFLVVRSGERVFPPQLVPDLELVERTSHAIETLPADPVSGPFDLAIFTSRPAVDRFLARDDLLSTLPGRVLAVGPATAERFRSALSIDVEEGGGCRALTSAGRTVGAIEANHGAGRLHLAATIRAAAPHQTSRGRLPDERLQLATPDLRLSVTEGRESNLVLLVVDASGSMAARRRMEAVKAATLSLLLDAYQRRDKVGLITFRGAEATLALPPTSSIDTAARRLEDLPSGGRTPLAEGLLGVLTDDGKTAVYSEKLACIRCGVSYPEITPRVFSFNSPHGACSAPPKPYDWSASATLAAVRCWCSSPTVGPPTAPTRSIGHGW